MNSSSISENAFGPWDANFADAEKQALTKKLAGENADSAVAQHLAG